MIPTSLLLSSLSLAYLPPTTAWVFSWTQPNGDLLTDHGSGVQSCQAIDNPKGNIFDWEANGDNVCIYLYGNNDCSNPSSGYTCKPWPWANHRAGSHILSYEVVINGTTPSSTTSTTPPATTATTSTPISTGTTTTSSAATTSSAPVNTSSGSSLSGGAIAGIVVGVLAAAAIAGILFFFLGWRRRRPSNSANDAAPAETAMSELQAADYKPHQEPPPLMSQSLYQQQRLRELPGSHPASEMGPGVERTELDGSPVYGKF